MKGAQALKPRPCFCELPHRGAEKLDQNAGLKAVELVAIGRASLVDHPRSGLHLVARIIVVQVEREEHWKLLGGSVKTRFLGTIIMPYVV